MSNVVENLVPYATYRWAEYKAMKADDQIKRESGEKAPESHATRMDKQFLTPKYEASIGSDFEDGLFDGVLPSPCFSHCTELHIFVVCFCSRCCRLEQKT